MSNAAQKWDIEPDPMTEASVLKISYDVPNDVVTIEGVKYTGTFFRIFSRAVVGGILKVNSTKDGYVDCVYLGHGRSGARKALR